MVLRLNVCFCMRENSIAIILPYSLFFISFSSHLGLNILYLDMTRWLYTDTHFADTFFSACFNLSVSKSFQHLTFRSILLKEIAERISQRCANFDVHVFSSTHRRCVRLFRAWHQITRERFENTLLRIFPNRSRGTLMLDVDRTAQCAQHEFGCTSADSHMITCGGWMKRRET